MRSQPPGPAARPFAPAQAVSAAARSSAAAATATAPRRRGGAACASSCCGELLVVTDGGHRAVPEPTLGISDNLGERAVHLQHPSRGRGLPDRRANQRVAEPQLGVRQIATSPPQPLDRARKTHRAAAESEAALATSSNEARPSSAAASSITRVSSDRPSSLAANACSSARSGSEVDESQRSGTGPEDGEHGPTRRAQAGSRRPPPAREPAGRDADPAR